MIQDEMELARRRLSKTVPPWKPRVPGWMLTRVIIRAILEAAFPAALLGVLLAVYGRIHFGIGFVLCLALIVWWLGAMRISELRQNVRNAAVQYYYHQRPPFCLHCGYDLRAITSAKCPECGIPLPSAQQLETPS